MKRRDFLRSISLSGAAAIAAPTVTLALSQTKTLKVGLLVPDGALGDSFLTGWREAGGVTPNLLERVSPTRSARGIVQDWLQRGAVDVIVSAFSAHGADVAVQLEGTGVPMLVADFGVNWMRPGSALVVRQGTGMARGAFALGQHAARTGTRTAAIVTSSFDAGFDHVQAFRLGFEGAGGRVLETLLLDSSAVPWNPNRLFDLRADGVFVAASDAMSLKDVRFPLGTRILAGGLAGWLLRGLNLETALSLNGSRHPARGLGFEVAELLARASKTELSTLPALLQARQPSPIHHLELRDSQVLHRATLPEPAVFDAGVQQLRASRSSGFTNAYPIL
jgi:hypothetical protein